jgi:hypothetical protein
MLDQKYLSSSVKGIGRPSSLASKGGAVLLVPVNIDGFGGETGVLSPLERESEI